MFTIFKKLCSKKHVPDFFVPIENADWDREDVVLCHELSHAFIWYYYKKPIDYIRVTRCNSISYFAVGFVPYENKTKENANIYLQRYLAGDIGSRLCLELPLGRIALRNFNETYRLRKLTADQLANFTTENFKMNDKIQEEDSTKSLRLAYEFYPKIWDIWIKENLSIAEQIISQNFSTIQNVAEIVRERVPTSKNCPSQKIILGGEINELFHTFNHQVNNYF